MRRHGFRSLGVDIDRRSTRRLGVDIGVRWCIWGRHCSLCILAARHRYLRRTPRHRHGDRSGDHLPAGGHGAVDDLAPADRDGPDGREPSRLLDPGRAGRDGRAGQGGARAGGAGLVDRAGGREQRRVGPRAGRGGDGAPAPRVARELKVLVLRGQQAGVAGRTRDCAPVYHVCSGICGRGEADRLARDHDRADGDVDNHLEAGRALAGGWRGCWYGGCTRSGGRDNRDSRCCCARVGDSCTRDDVENYGLVVRGRCAAVEYLDQAARGVYSEDGVPVGKGRVVPQ